MGFQTNKSSGLDKTGSLFCLAKLTDWDKECFKMLANKLKMNLQMFTEEASVDPAPVVIGPGNPEFDAAVSKAVNTALENNNKKWQAQLDEREEKARQEGKTEAEKLAQMNAEQAAEYQRKQTEEALAKREADITARELRAQSLTQLADEKLPLELVDVLDLTDADKCDASIKGIKAAWEKAHGTWEASLEKAVNERLVSSVDNPLGGTSKPSGSNPFAKESFNLTEQGRLLRTDPEKAKVLKAQANKK